jgi:hypothetical protein
MHSPPLSGRRLRQVKQDGKRFNDDTSPQSTSCHVSKDDDDDANDANDANDDPWVLPPPTTATTTAMTHYNDKNALLVHRKRWKLAFLILFLSITIVLCWLGITTTTTTILLPRRQLQVVQNQGRRLLVPPPAQAQLQSQSSPIRILYIITTLAEYNTGTRNTVRGSDRLQETLIPVMTEGVQSMVQAGYHVDVYIVCHYTMKPERLALIRQALPVQVGLQYWDNATPLGYDTAKELSLEKLHNRTLHLARQHRFVIKEQLPKYDMFVCFEDDMLIKGHHIDHHRAVTAELQRLRELAPEDIPASQGSATNSIDRTKAYHGVMTKDMLKRVIPGYIRVEVLLDEDKYPAQSNTGPVPADLYFDEPQQQQQHKETIDSSLCCHVSTNTVNDHIPASPSPDKIMLWETNIFALGIRQMPPESWLNWVVLQRGPNQNNLDRKAKIGEYWSNEHLFYWPDKPRRPQPQDFKFINNQGGWMATREQLWEWHTEICPGGFLPPYEAPHYRYDGLDMRNVEWYSGGMQLSTVRHACNMQRIILLDPKNFSKSLLYHSANNKQRQLKGKREEVFSKANTLLGQLNAVKKRAAAEMTKRMQ